MSKIVLTEDLNEERAREQKREEKRKRFRRLCGLCETCGCKLEENINQGILICAHTHEEQYNRYTGC